MLQNYVINSYILPIATIVFVNDVAVLCSQKMAARVRLLFAFYPFLKPISVLKTGKKVLTSYQGNRFKFLFINQFLLTAFAQGRGGGGGHGNLDWVVRHPIDA